MTHTSYRGYDLYSKVGVGVEVYFRGELVDTCESEAQALTTIDSWLNAR